MGFAPIDALRFRATHQPTHSQEAHRVQVQDQAEVRVCLAALARFVLRLYTSRYIDALNRSHPLIIRYAASDSYPNSVSELSDADLKNAERRRKRG